MALPVLLHPREGRSASVGSLVPAPLIPHPAKNTTELGDRSRVPPCRAMQLFVSAEAPRLHGKAAVSWPGAARWGSGLPLPVTNPHDRAIHQRALLRSSSELPQLTAGTIYL